jgi:hypothetical protein
MFKLNDAERKTGQPAACIILTGKKKNMAKQSFHSQAVFFWSINNSPAYIK